MNLCACNSPQQWDEIMKMNVDDCEEEFEKRIMNMAPNKLCALITTVSAYKFFYNLISNNDNFHVNDSFFVHFSQARPDNQSG